MIISIHEKNSLLSIFLTVFIDLIGIGMAIPVITPLLISSNDLFGAGVSLETRNFFLGLLLASYPVFQFFGAPLLGALSDRYGRKKILVISLLGTAIGYILFAIGIVTHQLWLLFLSRSLDGFTGGNIATAMSVISDVSEGKDKAKNFGLVGMAFGLGFILGPFLGGILSDPSIWKWFNNATPFWAAALLCIFNITLLVFRFQETLKTTIHTKITPLTGFKNVATAWHMPNLRRVFLTIFLLTFGFTFFTQFFQVFLIERFNYSNSQVGNLFAYVGLWMAFTQGVLTRPTLKRFKVESILSAAVLGMIFVFPVITMVQTSWVLYTIIPFIAIFQGHIQPTSTAIISDLAGREAQGEVMGINQSVISLAMVAPPIISGLIAGLHYTLPLFAASIFTGLGWLVFANHRKHKTAEQFHVA